MELLAIEAELVKRKISLVALSTGGERLDACDPTGTGRSRPSRRKDGTDQAFRLPQREPKYHSGGKGDHCPWQRPLDESMALAD
jgi:hypothetical protein